MWDHFRIQWTIKLTHGLRWTKTLILIEMCHKQPSGLSFKLLVQKVTVELAWNNSHGQPPQLAGGKSATCCPGFCIISSGFYSRKNCPFYWTIFAKVIITDHRFHFCKYRNLYLNLGSSPSLPPANVGSLLLWFWHWTMTNVPMSIAICIQLCRDIYILWSIVTFNEKAQKPNVDSLCQTINSLRGFCGSIRSIHTF